MGLQARARPDPSAPRNKPEVSPWREILLDAIRTASSSWTSSRSASSSPGYNRAFRRFSATRVNPPPVAFRHLLGVFARLERNLPLRAAKDALSPVWQWFFVNFMRFVAKHLAQG